MQVELARERDALRTVLASPQRMSGYVGSNESPNAQNAPNEIAHTIETASSDPRAT